MNPSRDAGKFAYHLKFLLRADLIEADVEARKYCLTDLGKMVIDVADRVEKKASKPKGMLVRTSRSALEEFDTSKIASSLMKEAKVPAELAQKVAKEAEKQLLKSRTKYLTAPLVREVVNAILVEKGLEEHRHKLTRLGLPVHEVAGLIEARSKTFQGSASIVETAGETVLKEYTLLNVFPRDVADAHLSGALHVNGLGLWILKPNEVMHDLRFLLQHSLSFGKTGALQASGPTPQNLESALSAAFNVLLCSARETCEAQTLDYFNIFLAPFVRGLEPSRVKEALRTFISNVSQHVPLSLGLELTIPSFVVGLPFRASGKAGGTYGVYSDESQLLASLAVEVFAEESEIKPLSNPKIIIKLRSESFADERAKAILLKAHALASAKGLLYFANIGDKQKQSAFSASGFRVKADMSGDWEIDTLRTGCLGCVTVNLPRVVYDSGNDRVKFFEVLQERLEMTIRALDIKYRALKQSGRGLLPFLMQDVDGDQYLRLEGCSWVVNLAGFGEATEAFCGKNQYSDEGALGFAEEAMRATVAYTQKTGRRRARRVVTAVLPSPEASERLAKLDIERFGVGKVRFSGTRERPFYSTVSRLAVKGGELASEAVAVDKRLHDLYSGGGLTAIDLGETEYKPDELVSLSRRIVEDGAIEFFTYDRRLTYCANCRRSWPGLLHKCPSCGGVSTLSFYDRFASV